MKRFQTIVVYLVALALSGAVTLKSDQPGSIPGKAIVRSISAGGNATYTAGGATGTLKANMELDPGTTITTGPDTTVYLNVNGVSSAVRVQPDTTMAVPTMNRIGAGREGDTETMLDLKVGTILGSVKKVSANSTYDIKTPHGVAGIRGTDFGVVVIQEADNRFTVTFTSVSGEVIVSAVVEGAIQVRTLHTGESWTPGSGDVHPSPLNTLDQYRDWLADLRRIFIEFFPPPPHIPIYNPFPTGGPPGGGSSSGAGPGEHHQD